MTVQVSDIETALGRTLTAPEVDLATQLIGDARTIIEIRLGDLLALNQAALDLVTREAVVARMQNPGGYQYEAIDDYRYGLPAESRRVTILPEWWEMLSPSVESSAWSTRPSFEPGASKPDAWVTTTEMTP